MNSSKITHYTDDWRQRIWVDAGEIISGTNPKRKEKWKSNSPIQSPENCNILAMHEHENQALSIELL
jgi:hypothetical protein